MNDSAKNNNKVRAWVNPILADDNIFIIILLVLVGLASFGLGRQSTGLEKAFSSSQPAEVTSSIEQKSEQSSEELESATYVGSVNSDKYHLTWCSGAKRINEANKVYFNSKEEARVAGYVPAGNCPGI